MAERHPSRTVLLVPKPDEDGGLDADVSVRCFSVGERAVASEVIELTLRGNRAVAPASVVLPLAISDLPVFVRWRGQPPFGATEWEQLVELADRVVVDSSEWEELRYQELPRTVDRAAMSDIAWARTATGASSSPTAGRRSQRRTSPSAARAPRRHCSAAGSPRACAGTSTRRARR